MLILPVLQLKLLQHLSRHYHIASLAFHTFLNLCQVSDDVHLSVTLLMSQALNGHVGCYDFLFS
jgi:hypothetical protein